MCMNLTNIMLAIVKSFPTQDEARAYVAGKELPPSSTLRSPQVERFYGVMVGRIPGVYTDWTTAQEQIVGWKGPKYKKFNTRAEAEEFVRGGSTTTSGLQSAISTDVDDVSNDELVVEAPAAKRAKQSSSGNGRTTKRAEFEEDEVEDDSINVIVPAPAVKPQGTNVLRIYTDGSSLGNGKQGARAGLGVYFGPGDSR
jgi:ribonuclease HI